MSLALLLPAAWIAGFFGSGHCFGMCGAVVVLLERSAPAASWSRRLASNAGRLVFYGLLGAVAGAAGFVLSQLAGVAFGLSILRFSAALLVLALGLNLLFNLQSLRFLEQAGSRLWRQLSPLAARFLPITSLPRAFGAGFVWGALPCGLVYSAVAMAATTGSAGGGALVMLAFWAGTLPALLLAGVLAGRTTALSASPAVRRASGAAMVAIAVVALMLPLRHSHDAMEHESMPHEHSQHHQ